MAGKKIENSCAFGFFFRANYFSINNKSTQSKDNYYFAYGDHFHLCYL